jgi:hypothetical protein
MLTAEDILKPSDLKAVRVDVPEWGGCVYVAELRADERDRIETDWLSCREGESMVGFRGYITAACLCDESRKFLFPEPVQVYKAIGAKDSKGVTRVFSRACELNGFTKADQDELLKNSEAAPNASGSGA